MDFVALIHNCAPDIEPSLAIRQIRKESNFNPYAIGLDGKASLRPQPANLAEAIAVGDRLLKEGKKFSVGLAQVHILNVVKLGLTWEQAFDPCTNLKYGQGILQDFHRSALKAGFSGNDAVFAALRGYNSGDIYGAVSNDYAASITGGYAPAIQVGLNKRIPSPSRRPGKGIANNFDSTETTNLPATPANQSKKESGDLFED